MGVRSTMSDDPLGGQSSDVIAAKQQAPIDAFNRQREKDLEARNKLRAAEGGRGGGHNDRQEVVRRSPPREEEASGYDDFGRRITGSSREKAAAAAQEGAGTA